MSFPKSFQPLDQDQDPAPNFPSSFQPLEVKGKKDIPKIPGHEIAGQGAIGALHGAVTAIPTTVEGIQSLVDLLPQGEKSAFMRRMIVNTLFPLGGGPTLEQTKAAEKSVFGESTQPTTTSGRIARHAGEFLGSEVGFGGKGVKGAAAGGGLGETIRELGLPEGLATAAEIVTQPLSAAAKHLAKPTVQGAIRNFLSPKKKALYDRYKSLGLSDQEITPLLQGETKVQRLGPFAKKTKAAKEAIFETSQKGIGELYNPLKQEAAALGNMSQDQLGNLHGRLKKNLQDLKKTLEPSPEKDAAIKYLENAITNMEGQIIGPSGKPISYKLNSPESLINFIQDINAGPHWNKLNPVKDTVKQALTEVDPKLARNYELTNEAFSKIKNLQKSLGLDGYEKLVSFGESGLFLGGLITMNPAMIGGAMATEVGRNIATKLLTDPRWQGITRNVVKAGKSGNKQVAITAYNQLKQKVKEEFPEEYSEIDWPD